VLAKLALLCLLALSLPSMGATPVYRCGTKGKVTYQDTPCDVPSSEGAMSEGAAAGDRPSSSARPGNAAPVNFAPGLDYKTALGSWRGPLQFNVMIGGERDPDAHRLAPLVLEVSADGSVRGTSSEVGCGFLGLARQMFATVKIWTLDLTAKGCADARFNQRYSGTLAVYEGTKTADLALNALRIPVLGGKAAVVQLSAPLKR
jgi:hypothetical protein